jgi:hypothetical protein
MDGYSRLEWALQSTESALVRRHGSQTFREFLVACQAFKRDFMVNGGFVRKGASGAYVDDDGNKYYPNDFYQDGCLRGFIRGGCKSRKSAIFFVGVIRFYYGVEFLVEDLMFMYNGIDSWKGILNKK